MQIAGFALPGQFAAIQRDGCATHVVEDVDAAREVAVVARQVGLAEPFALYIPSVRCHMLARRADLFT